MLEEENFTFDRDRYRIIAEHPCYSENARHRFGRMHLAVAPKCNIQCNFCVRDFACVNENRPGVTMEILTPAEALEKVRQALSDYPFIKVIGVAGPGDPLANEETFEALRLVRQEFPNITFCMSTNGLMLPEKLPELVKLGVATLTVTINAVDPEIQGQICEYVNYHGKIYRGVEGARIQIKNQLDGIEAAVREGIVIKVNTVLVPGINDGHVVEIAKAVREREVYIMNIMSLIPQGAFAHIRAPTPEERQATQDACEPYVRQMRHCRQCRADAYGYIDQDMSQMSEERRNLIKIQIREDLEKAKETLNKNGKEES
ncbi:radical SAM protein [Methanosarcina mazei]|uniref:FeMo cofactor biosynthesis protein NifB n=3 Tax=Methanosarcina mazei TaxID=2209 RepID=A0A0F8HYU4_METMZ|nr:radical SAM protein [Methanosarcina mazei]AKB63755.1 Nitrogenase FeMo-cofactor synthesis FeS core scaffold and assembly protein NifB [Methanosarcina mazei S-6]AKB67090.1 Nitrogenase FeMo-cofactor synthesis FeS core scaffold and assembly protein NifB [Methanosarcina mazei LYC]KKG34200.1 nitrogenase molybdenum-iron cofactor biosynthesis protein [Methanosarcina mazei]KKG40081.1 nitrogenase molybdenum-iron cofactor biosynthesis protein [Methanosarcina mazei]KKG40590.1 nitrogenase molybdenum-iro